MFPTRIIILLIGPALNGWCLSLTPPLALMCPAPLLDQSSSRTVSTMVSTTSQYITDAPPTSSSEGKNPLALLAKTCETIGLPDSASDKRRTPEKKDSSALDAKKSDSAEKKRISPRSTPTTSKSEPITSTTFPGLPKSAFPMAAFPGMMPFYPTAGMMPFPMPSFFPMAPFMGRVPCPSALMRTPCVTPGCTSCTPDMSAAAMMNPLFSAYAAMMPTSSASAMGSYQQLLAAAAHSASSANTTKHTCNWVESTGLCGKQFCSAEELASHMKASHAPSPPSSATTPDSKTTSNRRFHPYAKGATMPAMTPFNPMFHAMYAQRMMGMPHP